MAAIDGPDGDGAGAASRARVEQFSEGGALVLAITGEVDLSSVLPLRDRIEQALQEGPGKVVFDLGGVQFMDSSGIALLLAVAQQVETVEIRNPSHMMRRVIELSGLTATLHITP